MYGSCTRSGSSLLMNPSQELSIYFSHSFPYTFLIEGFIGSLSRLSSYCSPFCKYLIQFNPLHLTFPLQSTNPEVGKQFKLDRPIKSVQSEAVVQRCSVKKMFLEILQNSRENTCAGVSFLVKLQA